MEDTSGDAGAARVGVGSPEDEGAATNLDEGASTTDHAVIGDDKVRIGKSEGGVVTDAVVIGEIEACKSGNGT